ncbi:hypothetical protein [Sulfurimonas sp.]
MYKFILFLCLSITVLYASNPLMYAVLGDKIYNNLDNIKKLTTIGDYYLYQDDINKYIVDVNKAKAIGLSLDENSSPKERKAYLKELRELSSENDYYTRLATTSLYTSMQNGNSLLFTKIINSGLINTQENKKVILDYYFAHQNDINTTGVIDLYLKEDKELKAKREASAKKLITKKMKEEQRIKRIRKDDEIQQLKLEKRLDKAVEKKKKEIRKEQKKELLKSI